MGSDRSPGYREQGGGRGLRRGEHGHCVVCFLCLQERLSALPGGCAGTVLTANLAVFLVGVPLILAWL
ncbi:hypothetical protein GCM10012275_32010 [Longimycelium tulufanense]|uniref:Uncharacterized protein n=1 Tax=Longimycelium tulufanense TaxID=907463 RepID=A0A8J3CF78_9PSEU|nr:hypothetical protein GCM10012275_32010 [Longimycelium tulufanense]